MPFINKIFKPFSKSQSRENRSKSESREKRSTNNKNQVKEEGDRYQEEEQNPTTYTQANPINEQHQPFRQGSAASKSSLPPYHNTPERYSEEPNTKPPVHKEEEIFYQKKIVNDATNSVQGQPNSSDPHKQGGGSSNYGNRSEFQSSAAHYSNENGDYEYEQNYGNNANLKQREESLRNRFNNMKFPQPPIQGNRRNFNGWSSEAGLSYDDNDQDDHDSGSSKPRGWNDLGRPQNDWRGGYPSGLSSKPRGWDDFDRPQNDWRGGYPSGSSSKPMGWNDFGRPQGDWRGDDNPFNLKLSVGKLVAASKRHGGSRYLTVENAPVNLGEIASLPGSGYDFVAASGENGSTRVTYYSNNSQFIPSAQIRNDAMNNLLEIAEGRNREPFMLNVNAGPIALQVPLIRSFRDNRDDFNLLSVVLPQKKGAKMLLRVSYEAQDSLFKEWVNKARVNIYKRVFDTLGNCTPHAGEVGKQIDYYLETKQYIIDWKAYKNLHQVYHDGRNQYEKSANYGLFKR